MTFDYDRDFAFEGVSEILADLTCDTEYFDSLARCLEDDTLTFGDLEDDHPDEYECYSNMADEVFGRLIDNERITEEFYLTHPEESDELGDYIDDCIELTLKDYLSLQ